MRGSNRLTLLVVALLIAMLMVSACSMGQPANPLLANPAVNALGVADGGDAAATTTTASSRCDVPGSLSAAAVKTCVTQGGDPSACLARVFHPYLASHTTAAALAFLQCLEDTDVDVRVACHPVAHAIGRETFAVKGSVDAAFQACDQTCHSGCYHGAMERFLRGDTATNEHISFGELQAKVATACPSSLDLRLRYQCLHGLGHALMYYTSDDLKQSLALCDATGDEWSAGSCWGGVFMENIVSATPSLRDVSANDYHYPCDKLDERFKQQCYAMQTSRMTEMGLSPAQIMIECRNAGAYQITCIESLGRDLSNVARFGDPKTAAATCELGSTEQIHACTRGAVYALVDNTWDGRFALVYCNAYALGDSVAYCYYTAIDYLRNAFGRTSDELAQECAQYAPGQTACLAPLGR